MSKSCITAIFPEGEGRNILKEIYQKFPELNEIVSHRSKKLNEPQG